MEFWILGVLVLILFQLMRINSRFPEPLLRELKEIREALCWFKDDKFAGRLFKEIKENCEKLERGIKESGEELGGEIKEGLDQIREELYWFKDDKFAGHLFKQLSKNYQELNVLSQK